MKLATIVLALVTLAAGAEAGNTLSVTRPKELADMFSQGRVEERPSLFGMPDYGRSLRAQVFWPKNETDQLACDEITEKPVNPNYNPVVYLLVRGQCTFVTKVRNAQEAGASAVVVIDNVDGALPHMANDGTGTSVTIPSMIISRLDGDKITSFSKRNPHAMIELSIEYGMSQTEIVEYSLWTSAMDPGARDFKRNFVDAFNVIQAKSRFTARYSIIDGRPYGCDRDELKCGSQCTNKGRYCAVDPDSSLDSGVSGADVVQENTRQMCLFDIVSKADKTILWWTYVNKFDNHCAQANDVSEDCFRRVINTIPGVSADEVLHCAGDTGVQSDNENSRIEIEMKRRIDEGVYILPTVIINDVTYYGNLNVPTPLDVSQCGVLSTICSAYIDGMEPAVCSPSKGCPIGKTRDACDHCNVVGSPEFISDPDECVELSGVSLGTVMGLIVVFVAVLIGAAFVYHRHSSAQIKDELRNIMSQYVPLSEGDPHVNSRLVAENL